MSGLILHLSILQSHVFLINSRLGLFTAATLLWRLFSRSYETILPSSLAMNHSSTLGFSPRLPVSVYGTSCYNLKLRGFSWNLLHTLSNRPKPLGTIKFSIPCGFSYKKFTYTLQRTIPSVRGTFINPSPHRSYNKYWNINQLSIHYPLRVRVRSRLTLRRLASLRKP